MGLVQMVPELERPRAEVSERDLVPVNDQGLMMGQRSMRGWRSVMDLESVKVSLELDDSPLSS